MGMDLVKRGEVEWVSKFCPGEGLCPKGLLANDFNNLTWAVPKCMIVSGYMKKRFFTRLLRGYVRMLGMDSNYHWYFSLHLGIKLPVLSFFTHFLVSQQNYPSANPWKLHHLLFIDREWCLVKLRKNVSKSVDFIEDILGTLFSRHPRRVMWMKSILG